MAHDPPIIELVLSLSFEPFAGTTVVDLVDLYRGEFEADYPKFQHAPVLPPLTLEVSSQPDIEMVTGLELPAFWFVGSDTHDLVQLQHDRVSQNWRRIGPFSADQSEYPGYEAVKGRFSESFGKISNWLEAKSMPLSLKVGELSYVNAIPLPREGDTVKLSEILTFYRPTGPRVPVMNFQIGWTEAVPEAAGFVSLATAIQILPDGQPALALSLSSRCDVSGLDLRGALARFDALHTHIHSIFDRVVAPEIAERAKQ